MPYFLRYVAQGFFKVNTLIFWVLGKNSPGGFFPGGFFPDTLFFIIMGMKIRTK